MLYIDSHVHIGNYKQVKDSLKNSIYKNKYRLYSSLTSESVRLQDNYIKQCDLIFGIPIVLKEIPILESNRYLLSFSSNKNNILPIYFIGDNIIFYEKENVSILKEHFIHHESTEWKKRADAYEFLAKQDGYLLLHSLASIRIPYVKTLRYNFPNMNIIIAHMGRDGLNNFDYMASVLQEFKKDSKIFFDVSTVHDSNYLLYGIRTIGCSRILFASDYPYECSGNEKISDFYNVFYKLGLSNNELEKIFFRNASEIAHLQ